MGRCPQIMGDMGRRRECSPLTWLVSNLTSWVARKEEDGVFPAVGRTPGGSPVISPWTRGEQCGTHARKAGWTRSL